MRASLRCALHFAQLAAVTFSLSVGVVSAQTPTSRPVYIEGQATVEVDAPTAKLEAAELRAARDNAIEAMFRPITLGLEGHLGAGLGASSGLTGASFAAGAGVSLGFPIGVFIEPFIRGDVFARSLEDGWLNSANLSTGLRGRFNPWAPLYVETAVGYGWSDAPFDNGAFLDFGAGFRFSACGLESAPSAFSIGTKVRIALQDNDHATGWFGTLGYSWGGPVASRFACPPEPPPSAQLPGGTVVIRQRTQPDAPQEPWVYEPPAEGARVEIDVQASGNEPWREEDRYSQDQPRYNAEPSAPVVFPWALGFEMAAGPVQTPAESYGYGGLLGVRAEFGEHLGVSARYGWLSVDPAAGSDEGSTTHGLFLGPQYRVFTDYDSFQAWRFALEGGYGFGRHAMPDGFILSADVTREIGLRFGGRDREAGPSNGALIVELGGRFQQGLGDLADYRSAQLLTGLKFGFMREGGPEEDVAATPHTFGAHMALGSIWGMRLNAGFLPTDWLATEARVEIAADGFNLDDDTTLGLGAGAKLYLDRWLPVAIEAGAGYSVGYGEQAAALTGPFADAGVYAWFGLCEAPIDIYGGLRGQLGLDSEDELDRLMFVFGVEYSGRDRSQTFMCRPPSPSSRVNSYVAPPSATHVTPGQTTGGSLVVEGPTGAAMHGVEAEASADASGVVEVESEPIDWPLSFHLGIGAGLGLEGGPSPLRPGLGVGAALGITAGDYIEPRIKASYRYLAEVGSEGAPSTHNFDIGADVRALLGPVYLQAGAGHLWQSGDDVRSRTDYFLDAGIGARFIDCKQNGDAYGINVGLEGRLGLGNDDPASALFVTAGYEWGTATGDLGCMPTVEVPDVPAEGHYEVEAEVRLDAR